MVRKNNKYYFFFAHDPFCTYFFFEYCCQLYYIFQRVSFLAGKISQEIHSNLLFVCRNFYFANAVLALFFSTIFLSNVNINLHDILRRFLREFQFILLTPRTKENKSDWEFDEFEIAYPFVSNMVLQSRNNDFEEHQHTYVLVICAPHYTSTSVVTTQHVYNLTIIMTS